MEVYILLSIHVLPGRTILLNGRVGVRGSLGSGYVYE